MARKNLALLLTAPGTAAIAVVRLSGPGVREFIDKYFSRPVKMGRCVHGELRDRELTIDDPVVVLCSENVADINLHGGNWIVRSVLELAKREGFAPADRIELPLAEEAVDSENLVEREMLQYLPLARTELAVRVLLEQPACWEKIESWRDVAELERVLGDRSLHWLLNLPQVAIVGPANVGKSTLANQLFAQERSITADVPGTTRDWVGEITNIDGLAVMLIDTPGQRASDDAIEQAAIAGSREQIAKADLVLVVLDQAAELSGDERKLLAEHAGAIVIANKADRAAAWNAVELGAIRTVATTGQGLDELRRVILAHFDCENLSLEKPRCWTPRQWELIQSIINDLKTAGG